jgi:cysteinyl-tRNA synthetase
LEKAYTPMTVRFFILQTQYRSTLDFSNEALQAAEKGLKRLMDAYEWLMAFDGEESAGNADKDLNEKLTRLLNEFDEFMDDDFNTARVMANMFEIVPVINSLKDKTILFSALEKQTFHLLKDKMKLYIENILGLKVEETANAGKMKAAMEVLIALRKEAREKKDWATSDKIRNQLADQGILIKDEKDGNMSWSVV